MATPKHVRYRGPRPSSLGSIRNFAWLVPGALARGEQPPDESYEALRQVGITAVVSLRAAKEQPRNVAGRDCPAYSAESERATCSEVGLAFSHVACVDNEAPSPEEVAAALCAIDDGMDNAGCVYVHCLGGVGRTGVVTAAWLIAHGHSGNRAAAAYQHFCHELSFRRELSDQSWWAQARRAGMHHQRWALHAIARALGSPITQRLDLPLPERPVGAESWSVGYRQVLSPWRERRSSDPTMRLPPSKFRLGLSERTRP